MTATAPETLAEVVDEVVAPARASSTISGAATLSTVGRSRQRREMALGYALVLPALVIFAVFTFYPFLWNFKVALFQGNPVNPAAPSHYVGLHNFSAVFGSASFYDSLWETLAFVAMVVPLSLLIGLALAVGVHRRLRGMPIYRVIFSSTAVSGIAVAAVVFGTLMNPIVGLLPWMGINPTPPLLENSTWALPSVALISVWQFTGLSFIIMSAGLQSVPDELLEAARIDGASAWTRFWRVTVPLLSPTIFFGVVVGTIYALQTFGQIDILIGASNTVQTHTNVLIYDIVNTLHVDLDPGQAAVLTIALFVLTLIVTVVQMRLLERRVHYG